MAAIDFPNNPTLNQTFTASNGVTYKWDGVVWLAVPAGGSAPTGPAGGDLSGTYPNPVVAKASGTFSTGGNTTVGGASQLIVPGPTTGAVDRSQVVLSGSRTVKSRINALNDIDWYGLSINNYWNGSAWTRDDATKSAWRLVIRDDATDRFAAEYVNTSNAASTPFAVQGSDGKTYCTLADTSVSTAMLAAGATTRTWVNTNAPVNWSSLTASAWVKVFDAASITTRGGFLIITAVMGGCWTVNPSGGTFYLGIGKAGTVTWGWRYDVKSPVTANTQGPLPTLYVIDKPAAGAYVYSFWIWQGPNVLCLGTGDSQGQLTAIEFA